MLRSTLLVLSLSLFITKSCYPVSHIIIGETQSPIDYTNVKVYNDYPENFEKIAIIEASSDLAFKDLSIDITHQQKTNKALKEIGCICGFNKEQDIPLFAVSTYMVFSASSGPKATFAVFIFKPSVP